MSTTAAVTAVVAIFYMGKRKTPKGKLDTKLTFANSMIPQPCLLEPWWSYPQVRGMKKFPTRFVMPYAFGEGSCSFIGME